MVQMQTCEALRLSTASAGPSLAVEAGPLSLGLASRRP